MEGFVEAVEAFQIRGWAYDPNDPMREARARIYLAERPLGDCVANIYRADLKAGGIGDGRHAFIFNLNQRLRHGQLDAVSVRVEAGGGHWEDLPRLRKSDAARVAAPRKVEFGGRSSDERATPIFVLGAARSGTSAVAQALLSVGYEGCQEGHFFDLLAHWAVGLDRFIDLKGDEIAGDRDTLAARFSREYLGSALDALFLTAAGDAFSTSMWIDKTPTSDMIYLAPRLKRIWPQARFIFMRRRFFENVESRRRKFAAYNFHRNCEEWGQSMDAWLEIRSLLPGCAIEIDQFHMMRNPGAAALSIGRLAGWTGEMISRFEQSLSHDWPQRTAEFGGAPLSKSSMGWSPAEIDSYDKLCAKSMREFGYSEGEGYFEGHESELGIRVF